MDWSEAEKTAFLRMQFNAQHTYYQTHYTDTDFLIILSDDQPIGRLYLSRWEDEFRLVDITLLPEVRNRGTGTKLIQDILDEARAQGKPVRGHVEPYNPALHLYQRLGFKVIEDKGAYLYIEWSQTDEEPDR